MPVSGGVFEQCYNAQAGVEKVGGRMDVSHAGLERKADERAENGAVRDFCRRIQAFNGAP